jgi:hypothetical protein
MRYKVDWFIPQQILALTHLVPEVSQEDFIAILEAVQSCLQQINQPFHLIIDNRIIKSEQVATLEVILNSNPQLQALPLRWILMVLPYTLQEKATMRETQQIGSVQLMYVDSIQAAFAAFQKLDTNLNWEYQLSDFFAKDS